MHIPIAQFGSVFMNDEFIDRVYTKLYRQVRLAYTNKIELDFNNVIKVNSYFIATMEKLYKDFPDVVFVKSNSKEEIL